MFTRVAAAADIPNDRGLRVQVGDVEIGLYRIEGDVVALGDLCPHAGIPLHEGDIEAGCIVCPGHGWEFDLRTGAGPFGESALLYPVKLDGDDVLVDADSPYEG